MNHVIPNAKPDQVLELLRRYEFKPEFVRYIPGNKFMVCLQTNSTYQVNEFNFTMWGCGIKSQIHSFNETSAEYIIDMNGWS